MAATQVWTVGSLLSWTVDYFQKQGIDEARLSAELLLAFALNCSRMALYTQFERVPGDEQIAAFRELVKQRAKHVPVAYLTGRAWFFSLELKVSREVLIPGADTETLVEYVIQHGRQRAEWSGGASGGEKSGGAGPAILDLCAGSGAIAIALAVNMAGAAITAVDISAGALLIARENAQAYKVGERIVFLEGDLLAPLEKEPGPTLFHAIVSNPPYIPTGAIAGLPPAVRDYVPRLALDGGGDGMEFHRRIVAGAPRHLRAGGLLAMEMNFDQGPGLQAILAASGQFENIRMVRDAAGHPRCIVGFKAAVAG